MPLSPSCLYQSPGKREPRLFKGAGGREDYERVWDQPQSHLLVSTESHGSCVAPICGIDRCGVRFGLPSLLGGQVGQELQLCLGILGDPASTKKWAGMKVGLLSPSFHLAASLWLSIRPFSLGLAPEIYHSHLDCLSHLLPPCPRFIFLRQALLLPVGPPCRERLGLYSPVGQGNLAGLEIPRGRSEEKVSPPPAHSGGKRNRSGELQVYKLCPSVCLSQMASRRGSGTRPPQHPRQCLPDHPSLQSSLGDLALLGDPATKDKNADGTQSPCPQATGRGRDTPCPPCPAHTHRWTLGTWKAFRSWWALGTQRNRTNHSET